MSEWDDDAGASEDRFVPPEGVEGYGGRPGLATTICAFLLVGSCVGSAGMPARPMAASGAETIGQLVGGALVGALLWGIAYAITIKRASPRAKIVTLAILMTLGLATTLVSLGRSRAALGADARTAMAEANRAVKGPVDGRTMRAGPDAGPLTRLTASGANEMIAMARRYGEEANAAGLDQVTGFVGLNRTSPVLGRCDRVAALADQAAANRRALPAIRERVGREGETMVTRGELAGAQLDAFLDGLDQGQGRAERQWTLAGDLARDGAALCGILARRRWQLGADGTVLFTDDRDLTEARPILARVQATSTAMAALADEARGNIRRSAEQVRRF